MTNRAPIVTMSRGEPGAADVNVKPADRGDTHRTVRVHWHADDDLPGADAVLRVYRDGLGAPVITIDAMSEGGHVVVNPAAGDAAAQLLIARAARKAPLQPLPQPVDDNREFWEVWADETQRRKEG